MELSIVEHEAFYSAIVDLDGKHFRECTFVGCQLRYAGGMTATEMCHFSDDCTYFFTDAAYRTALFLFEFGFMPEEALQRLIKPSSTEIH